VILRAALAGGSVPPPAAAAAAPRRSRRHGHSGAALYILYIESRMKHTGWRQNDCNSPGLAAPAAGPCGRRSAKKTRATAATARAGNRCSGPPSALCTRTNAPYNIDSRWDTPRALNRPGRARAGGEERRALDDQPLQVQ
jgi:hypothetical protein